MADTLKVALVSRTVFYAPVWVAERKGYFKDEGVEPRLEIFDNAEKINAVMRSGEAQIAIASVEALVADAFKGGQFRIVASVAQKPPHFIIARPHIKTVNDLKGARFGVLSLHEGTTYFVQDIEKALGWTRGDIVIDAVGGAPTRWKLLREGKIDAGLQPFPLSYESEDAGFSNLGRIATYVPDYEFTAAFLDPAWAASHRQAVTGFLRALVRGQAAMAAEPDFAADVLVKELGTTLPYARRAIADALNFKLMPAGLAASETGMRRVFTTLQGAGLVPSDAAFDMTRFVDPSYLAAAR
ncbi:MAG: ABC transporter substrate-binding protein [Xanthobacteraceae bacterium]|nr:ABC transporter substrate-binding protein [Xanthobacteraceae bacterium]